MFCSNDFEKKIKTKSTSTQKHFSRVYNIVKLKSKIAGNNDNYYVSAALKSFCQQNLNSKYNNAFLYFYNKLICFFVFYRFCFKIGFYLVQKLFLLAYYYIINRSHWQTFSKTPNEFQQHVTLLQKTSDIKTYEALAIIEMVWILQLLLLVVKPSIVSPWKWYILYIVQQ